MLDLSHIGTKKKLVVITFFFLAGCLFFSANLFRSQPWSFLFCPFVHHLVLEKLSDAHHVHERDAKDQGDEAPDLDKKRGWTTSRIY